VTKLIAVAHENASVLGYTDRALWDQLVWNGLEYADHGPHLFAGNYGYLHVCAWVKEDNKGKRAPKVKNIHEWFDRGGVMYRVRPRMQPGKKLRGKEIQSVEVEKIEGVWTWIVVCTEVPKRSKKK